MYCRGFTSNAENRSGRRGVVLVAVVVLIAISLSLFGIWAQSVVREHGRLAGQQLRLQASRLAEAGVQRAMARRAANSQYEEETWTVPADRLGSAHAAEVRIRVTTHEGAATIRCEATAEFPIGAVRRAQVTKRNEFPNPSLGDES